MLSNLSDKKVILASNSPRRQHLLKGLDIPFEIRLKEVIEDYPPALQREEVPRYLSRLKAKAYMAELAKDEILLTSDTTVFLNGEIIEKPGDEREAFAMLRKLSGVEHIVITAFTITEGERSETYHDETKVLFKDLSDMEIKYYIENYQPFDKAGSYGAQEYLGYIAIERLEGSYFNVMGLPVHLVYEKLKAW